MTDTIEDIVTEALVMTGAYGEHENIDGPDLNRGMVKFQRMIDGWVHAGLLGGVDDTLIEADGEASEFQRIASTVDAEVTLPATVQDPDGTVRAPMEGAIVILALGTPHRVYIFSSIIADWVPLTDLALTDIAPLGGLGGDGLAACLAEHMGGEIRPEHRRQAMLFRAMLASRKTQTASLAETFGASALRGY